jgi:hypothetical protein
MSQFLSYPRLLILTSKWASILLSTCCLLYSEWAFIPTMDSLFSTFQTGLYKENILSHNSPSERIIAAQESIHLLGFLDADDVFLTRVEMPFHFSGDLFRLLLLFWFLLLSRATSRVLTFANHHCISSLPLRSLGLDWWM